MGQTKKNSEVLQDPVRGMMGDRDSPPITVHESQKYGIYSPHCLMKFREKPAT